MSSPMHEPVAATQVLAGMRVVEGSAFVAAPSGGMALAQLGAEVIRFDQVGGGLDYHRWPLSPNGTSLYWAGLNKGKQSIALDLRSDEGRDLVTALIGSPGPDGGIFLSNFPNRGWMSYETLRSHRDDLIMVSISGNADGSTAVDYTVNCAVGYPDATGPVGLDAPVNHVFPAWDVVCGQMAAVGVLAAERHRNRTGAGQLVSLALADVAMATVANLGHVAEAEVLGEQRSRYGNDLYGAFGRDFATVDGRRVMVVAISPRQWTNLIDATDSHAATDALAAERGLDLAADESDRFLVRDELAAIFAPWFAARPLTDVGAALDANGVCWGVYQTFQQLVDDDPRCSTANPMFGIVDQPGIGSYRAPRSPLTFAGLEQPPVAPAPVLGQHTERVLAEVLGMSTSEIGQLVDRGVVATAD